MKIFDSRLNRENKELKKKIENKVEMVEYNPAHEESYKQIRPESIYVIEDARKVDYKKILDYHQFPCNIDYLQIDLEVNNRSTLDVLELFDRTVFDNHKFATVTFEHDIYTGDYFDTRRKSREIFAKRGYIMVFPDVQVFNLNIWSKFEDWYVHGDLVGSDIINKIKTDESLTCNQIKEILKKLL